MLNLKIIIILFIYSSFLFSNEILLLHSYNKGLKWSDGISRGVENIMQKHPQYELTTEYMDSKKIESDHYFEELLDLYKKKFRNRRYKAVIVADNYAYEFALKYQQELFPKTPIIFCGVENFNPKDINDTMKPYVTGVVEYKDIRKNLELIYQLFPAIKMVYIISDDAYSSLVIKDQIIDESNNFQDKFRVVFDNQINFDAIDDKIEKLPKHSAILFTSFYRDMNDKYVPYYKLQAFFQRSPYPIFALNHIHVGEGVIGGYMVNPYEQGMLAAKKAFELINGKKTSSLPVEIPKGTYFFDNNILRKFGISLNDIPTPAEVLNGVESFYEKHRKFVENAFALMPLLLLLTTILVLNIIKRISLEKELLRQNKLDYVLLNNIQSAIFWKANDGIILGCNDLLCHILEHEKIDIIGKHVRDVMPTICDAVQEVPLDCPTSAEIEMHIPYKDKIIFSVRRTYYTDENNQEAGVVTILTDITEKKRIDTEHKRHEQFVIQRSKQSEVGEMIASIAHQWKTPLVEISAIAQELIYKRRKKALDEEDTQKFVDDIMTQVKYMSNTIDDFRQFIKPSSMQTAFDVRDAIDSLLAVVNHNVKYNYITIHIVQKQQGILLAFGYPNEFKQCVLNIINNAKDSIVKRRETQSIDGIIDIELDSDENNIYLSISDDGCGIEKSKLESIFDPFMSTKANGDGFGLYMARLIIEDKMGGKIIAKQKKSGAQIFITIQKAKGDA
ncbi:sensor histidine kinase [Sulfurospirillum multivorans]|uniref:histidine kinase n=2 Tax=Sulfurospirillum multivorans TaxID=66821 RepID=A0AA86AM18_SULMK|nr:ABC transporter substrate binding protein [Sulfurospirillum multivorans]AHJ12939.1 sensor kinase of two-component regulatory system [Sulfurospirillum multivorans DSM 12446]QEH06429.1 sensor kinase of two-component regulatory system [Sulfurospirillum multivorans]